MKALHAMAGSKVKAHVPDATVAAWTEELFGEDVHLARVRSIANGVTGVLHSGSLGVSAIGRGLAAALKLNKKHAVKQVDRLLGNPQFVPWELMGVWARFAVGQRKEIVVAIDWTDFEPDDHVTCAAHLVSDHGRTTSLVWKTVRKSQLAGQRARVEDEVIEKLHAALAKDVHITLLADRAFGEQLRYEHLMALGFDFVIRFRAVVVVEDEFGVSKSASEWLPPSGRATKIKNALVTRDRTAIPAVVITRQKRMKQAWCLATSHGDRSAQDVVKLYGRRFTIEESFRDQKDARFGFGLSQARVHDCLRRDRILMLATLAHALLTLLGAAGERAGMDRMLKVNTSKKRQLSLLNQGCFWYEVLPGLEDARLVPLMTAFGEILTEHADLSSILAVL